MSNQESRHFMVMPFGGASYRAAVRLRDEELRRPLGLSFCDAELEAEREQLHYGLVADSGALTACVTAVPSADGLARIRQMVVAPEHRGRGWGRRLLVATESDLRSRGLTRIVLHARVEAVGFYLRLGYDKLGDVFEEVSIPHQAMEKRIED